ncbi:MULTISPECIES: hypothetical protein [Pseudomonas syringae group]|uniref:Uncharacterized protein n=2 Tax=Pseudomonas syringae group TaxID=136849 RepID=A0A3M3JE03_9PSED|nr:MULTISPECIES: hypothetical protein [Pseudomonas syringae group]RMN08405.1 hypothetical protein ALQ65_200223 [Pseudomonas syringae pv. coriandricola]
MSQHFVCLHCEKINGPVRVQIGWDRPFSEFYMVVLEEPPAGQDFEWDKIVYSNDYDPTSHAKDLDYYKSIASLLGCEVPDVMWRAVYQDREFNVVNKTVFYSPDGDVVEPF